MAIRRRVTPRRSARKTAAPAINNNTMPEGGMQDATQPPKQVQPAGQEQAWGITLTALPPGIYAVQFHDGSTSVLRRTMTVATMGATEFKWTEVGGYDSTTAIPAYRIATAMGPLPEFPPITPPEDLKLPIR